jgi:YtkA-like
MTLYHSRRALAGVCLIATTALMAAPVRAAPADYRFEIVQVQSAESGKSNVTLRLVHIADTKPVTDAVIFQSTADMGPDNMPTMTAPVKAMPAPQPGIYIFQIEPGMAGNWELKLAAKVQGETETVRAALPVKLGK